MENKKAEALASRLKKLADEMIKTSEEMGRATRDPNFNLDHISLSVHSVQLRGAARMVMGWVERIGNESAGV